jgi:hypothetical protein
MPYIDPTILADLTAVLGKLAARRPPPAARRPPPGWPRGMHADLAAAYVGCP